MPSINIDLAFFDNRKVGRLTDDLGPRSEIFLIRLWCYVGKHWPDVGGSDDWTAGEVERAAAWDGAKGELVRVLCENRLLHRRNNGFYVHDWKEHAGHLVMYKAKARTAAVARWEKHRREQEKRHAPGNAPGMPQAMLEPCLSIANAMQCIATKTPDNQLTLKKDLNKTNGGCRGKTDASPGDAKPPGFSNSFSSGSLVDGLTGPHDIPWDQLQAAHVFGAFRDVFVDCDIPSSIDLAAKAEKCNIFPACWTMLFFDKLHYAHYLPEGESADPIKLTMAGFRPRQGGRRQSPTDAASGLFREIFVDRAGSPGGRGKKWEILNSAIIAEELEMRKGRK